jgi:hypothetical protein
MQIGDLVKVTMCSDYFGQVGIVTKLAHATMMNPCEVLSVTFFNTEKVSGIPSRWVKVLNESR